MLPNFLIVGAARSGTTTIYNHLKDHPDVYLPVNKRPEPHFFLKNIEYVQGLSYYEQRFFSGWRGQRAIGEASTSYLFGVDVPKRIRVSLPDVKLICILRDPVERAFSNYWHTVRSGLETLAFDDAILQEANRKDQMSGTALGEIAPFAYAERGFYYRQLMRWFAEFHRSQMKILIFEDFVADPNNILREIAGFLDVSPDDLPRRRVDIENRSTPDEKEMLQSTRKMLIEMFREDVQSLSRLLNRDLGHWLKDRADTAHS